MPPVERTTRWGASGAVGAPGGEAVRVIAVGTSGWSYDHWTDVLYPQRTPVARRLGLYVAEFDTVELNASFYRWPRDATFEGWQSPFADGESRLEVTTVHDLGDVVVLDHFGAAPPRDTSLRTA